MSYNQFYFLLMEQIFCFREIISKWSTRIAKTYSCHPKTNWVLCSKKINKKWPIHCRILKSFQSTNTLVVPKSNNPKMIHLTCSKKYNKNRANLPGYKLYLIQKTLTINWEKTFNILLRCRHLYPCTRFSSLTKTSWIN